MRSALLLVLAMSGCQCGDVRLGNVLSRLDLDPESIDFGSVLVGEEAVRAVTLTNSSSVTLTIDGLRLGGEAPEPFSVIPSTGPLTLRAGASQSLDVIYAPTRHGSHAARLIIQSGASNAPEVLVPLAGNTGSAPRLPGEDAGVVPVDAGTAPVDAGARVDAGPSVDAGPVPDAGSPVDAGRPFDGGLPELDAGPECSVVGTCCPDGLFREGTECTGATDLSLGTTHGCAIVDGGSVKCWGQAASGQLGVGLFASRSVKPVLVPGLSAIRVRASERFTCALAVNRTVWCWGENTEGQLGNGTTQNAPSPVQVQGLAGVRDLAVGSGFACAVTSTGDVQCWGRNDFRQLGVPGGNRSTPVTVTGLGAPAVSLSLGMGDGHACATLSTGLTRCWGYNGWGQLGDGTFNSPTGPVAAVNAPMGARVVVGVSTGCSLTSAGLGTCWGNNDNGQLGNGQRATAPPGVGVMGVTTPQTVLSGPWRALSAASRFHACGVTTQGGVKCWGLGQFLGDGTLQDRFTPGDVPGLLSGVRSVSVGGLAVGLSAGLASTCALLEAGGVTCWGDNAYGQLGNGTAAFTATPRFLTDL